MSLVKYFIAAMLLLAAVSVTPVAAGVMPPSCPDMSGQSAGHDGCPTGAAGCCCVEAVPKDGRCLILSHAPRSITPALAGTVRPAAWAAPVSRPLPAPQPRARAPVPLYLSTASLLI
ncbi:MAG: hypothetical protein KKC30_17070 [Proteobacteria bacterium]|nr:hypothetical protein [Pseudomonadota bacterium]MBU4382091.1 hypothetical protein [Pseudomonadota bacterium]MBU4606051.1 hypothetical protein [Pseudomonadota bacterium]MCG2762967.1 hypothetical protein [Desulfarculaceae bacterium]